MSRVTEENITSPYLSDTEEMADIEYDSDSTNMSFSMVSQGSVNGSLLEESSRENEGNESIPFIQRQEEHSRQSSVQIVSPDSSNEEPSILVEISRSQLTQPSTSLNRQITSSESSANEVSLALGQRNLNDNPLIVFNPTASSSIEPQSSDSGPSGVEHAVSENLENVQPSVLSDAFHRLPPVSAHLTFTGRLLQSSEQSGSNITEPFHPEQSSSTSFLQEDDQSASFASPLSHRSDKSRKHQTTSPQNLNETTPRKISGPIKDPPSPESDDDGQICSICFEPWANSGAHRLASLKCGHIFGNSCIERWLKGQGGKCPQCNAKATKRDIRVLYAKSLKVIDTAERDRVLRELEKEKEARRKLELDHAQTKLQYELKSHLVIKLQNELKILRNATASSSVSSPEVGFSQGVSIENKNKLIIHSALDIAKDGGCRVLAYNEWLNMVVVSMPSHVSMFPGCGVKKVNMLDIKSDRYMPIHSKQIRDMAFNPAKNDLLLTVGMDKLVKLTNVCNNAPVGSFTAESPLWSCCWNADHANQFFVGTATGLVLIYDTRNTDGPIKTIKVTGSGPVVSMCYIPYESSKSSCTGGLLIARLSSCSFVSINENEIKDNALLLEGPFTSVSYEKSTRHFMISCRPSQKYPHARHLVCELQSIDISSDAARSTQNKVVAANIIHTFKGGTTQKVLSRSCLVAHPSQAGSILACASDESTQSTCLWDVSSGACLQVLKCKETVIDIMVVRSNQSTFLALLTDKSVKFYKWVDLLS